MKHFLDLKNTSIGYSEPLISDINTSLQLGEVCLLMGNNGIGKTTLIKSILGQNKLLKGEISINGKSNQKLNSNEIASQIAIVFSKAEIPDNYTVTDLISLGKYIHYPYYFKLNETDKQEISDIITKLNLSEYQNKKLTELSDGNLQKVFIGRALAQNSPFIILDEPTTHLDEENKLMILSLLRNLAKSENKLILFSSHDWRLAKEFSDKIWWIKDKKLIRGISEEVILSNPELITPKILDFNQTFHPPEIDAPKLEKEMMFSFLQKNFSQNLRKFKLTFKNDFWELNLDNFYDNCHSFQQIKQSLQTLINKGNSN
ncbi:ABC transporter ATP-binding protein [Epilithonimonas zeae]|uniref:Iron complex transport system ATP-binding protein n=1 Tax=Epilithonimonas zeae TaxID=1416779 RepID=A0A1N6GBS2_9FLAO|nr:ABC transporter ATP-binding protein [Epilithonimonas zeae]SIO05000.1 iron complex transport system ATP-binding protein [Epilithonimonas zeae]